MSIVFLVLHTEPSKGGLIHLLRELVSELDFSVMCTTRTVRPGEQNGREFTFMSNEEFEDMIANNEFLAGAEAELPTMGPARFGELRERDSANRRGAE